MSVTDRQTTDGRATAYSKREHEFTFANKNFKMTFVLLSQIALFVSSVIHKNILCPRKNPPPKHV